LYTTQSIDGVSFAKNPYFAHHQAQELTAVQCSTTINLLLLLLLLAHTRQLYNTNGRELILVRWIVISTRSNTTTCKCTFSL
jgi:hypothetical protein